VGMKERSERSRTVNEIAQRGHHLVVYPRLKRIGREEEEVAGREVDESVIVTPT